MKVLIMTNTSNEEIFEDIWIADSFKQDGHDVCLVNIDYNEELDSIYDVFIRRNTWFSDASKISEYSSKCTNTVKRILDKDLSRINFNGTFDAKGKKYLLDLYNLGYPTIPTINNSGEINKLPLSDKYLLKPLKSYDGIGQIRLSKEEINEKFTNEYIIQPIMSFISEVQFYFIGSDFQYALEFRPSKIPTYPDAIPYIFTEEELKIATSFAKLNGKFYGIQRIDFIKLNSGEILLLEIEDTAPYLDLDCVSLETREQFLKNYKDMIYNYVNIDYKKR